MTSANPADLVKLLLQQSDRHPIRAVGAEDLQPFDESLWRSLRANGILLERSDLRDDSEAILQVVDQAMITLDPETGSCERAEDAMDIRMYDIDFAAICREIRVQSGLKGSGPTKITPRIWRVGRYVHNSRAAEVCLVRQLRPENAQEVVDHIRGAVDKEAFIAIIALSACDLPTPVVRQLPGMRIAISSVQNHLGNDPAAPFALDFSMIRLGSAAAAVEARLSIDRVGRLAIMEGVELSIEPRDFGVLMLLAEEAAEAGGWVMKDAISASIHAATGNPANPEQADRSINRLRDVFRKDNRLKAVPKDGFIQTKPKVGCRLSLPSLAISFVA